MLKYLKICVVTMFITLGFLTVSCQKEDLTPTEKMEISTLDGTADSTNINSRAYSTNYYHVSESILNHFIHYCQRMAGPSGGYYSNTENTISLYEAMHCCNTTCYMMAASCFARYLDGSNTQYMTNGTKLSGLISGFNAFDSDEGYRKLWVAERYANNNDASFLTANNYTNHDGNAVNRAQCKTIMQQALANNMFVMVPIRCVTNDYYVVNNSCLFSSDPTINPDVSSGISTYINTTGNGHVILIIGITVKPEWGNDGIVCYIDPLAIDHYPSNRRYVRYSKLLNSIESAEGEMYKFITVGLN